MEELFELRTAIEEQRYQDALILLGAIEEMSREDKVHKIDSFSIILLLYLIKQEAQQKTTRSWELFIYNSIRHIQKINKCRKSGGYYIAAEEIQEILVEAYPAALKAATLETFEGIHTKEQLVQKVDKDKIIQQAFLLIQSELKDE